jgi:hypothetical protein
MNKRLIVLCVVLAGMAYACAPPPVIVPLRPHHPRPHHPRR